MQNSFQFILPVGAGSLCLVYNGLQKSGGYVPDVLPQTCLFENSGANQAVAAARSAAGTGTRAAFACRFGSDAHAPMLESTLRDNGVDLSASGHSPDYPSGQVGCEQQRSKFLRLCASCQLCALTSASTLHAIAAGPGASAVQRLT